MQVLFVRNYKIKALWALMILIFWICMFLFTNAMMKNKLMFTMTIDQTLSFSYPLGFQMDGIYTDKFLPESAIETNGPLYGVPFRQSLHYISSEGKFSFFYPPSFILTPQELGGGEILYHIGFHSKGDSAQGFVQVWNMPSSLNDFLSASKVSSQQEFQYFSSKPVEIGGNPGVLWDYTILGHEGTRIKGLEVFLKKGDRMYRISYFVPESAWNQKQYDIFWSMANSLKIL